MSYRNFYQEYSFLRNDSSDLQAMNESILNHLFLPCDLPSSADKDYLIQDDCQNEYKILECMNKFLVSLNENNSLPIFSTLQNCIQQWSVIQNPKNCSVSILQSTIEKLMPGNFLPLYIHAQNAAVLIEIDENLPNQPLISSWQVLLPTETITSSLEPHLSCFPTATFRLSNRSQLLSRVRCELLVDFMKNTIEYSKSYKASYPFNETREVPISHYVCQWWITQFEGIEIDNLVNTSVAFKKKHRDQIRYKNGTLPFRRSGLWMTIKVVFHTILIKRLGPISIIIYKLLITNFLIYFISTTQISTNPLIHCLRKIARRLNKIENLLSSMDSNDMNEWIQTVIEEIKQKMNHLTPNSNWQKFIEKKQKENLSTIQLDEQLQETYHHPCKQLKAYLKKNNSNTTFKQSSYKYGYDYDYRTSSNTDGLPSISSIVNRDDDNIGIALIRIEIWVQSYLNEWINSSLLSEKGFNCFSNLKSFYEEYQRTALKFYYSENKSTDPIGYTRFILTSLTIIRLMHEKLCEDRRFEQLKLHVIHIPHLLDLFEFLVLPNRDDMIRACDLYDYFQNFNDKQYPDLLSNIESKNAFGVHFANQSLEMNATLQDIQDQIEQDKKDKIEEFNNAKEKYEQLMKKARELKCECTIDRFYQKCDQCTIMKEADNIKIHIHECPIPSNRESALAVIFELQMPDEFRCYRDILWQFINRPNSNPSNDMYEWLDANPHRTKLSRFNKDSCNSKVKLVSSTKSISQSHYSAPRQIASVSLEEIFYENSLKVEISPTKITKFQDECRTLTPQLTDKNYTDLQFSIATTQCVQNRVIAEQAKCSLQLKTTQFIEFGSFRSGHRLQWWNLFSILELDSLSMDDESVAILLTHALLQYGPMTIDRTKLIYAWCPESHQQLLDDGFVDELIMRLNRNLEDCECNWQNEMILVILTMVVIRIFTICNSTRKMQLTNLVLKCRNIGEKWIRLISEIIQNSSTSTSDKMDDWRDKIATIGIACILTFSIYTDSSNSLSLTDENIIFLMTIITTVNDNIILNKRKIDTSLFTRNLIRYSEHILVSIHPILNELLQKNSYENLNKFTGIYWAAIRSKEIIDGKWEKRNKEDIYDGWYDGEYESNKISIDCFRGKFLVNKMSIGFLPDRITSDELFLRTFGHHIFEVQAAELEDTYITKHGYHANGKVHYEFNYSYFRSPHLTIYERHTDTNDKFELIPPNCFEKELPDIFISNYSHWYNEKKNIIQFRSIYFQNLNFLTDVHYNIYLKSGLITTCNNEDIQYLINRSSTFFQKLFKQYFVRLDNESFVYMLSEDYIIHIHLSRLGIAFKYNLYDNSITSREYSDMYIDEDQWLGTLTGLQSGLLLSPIAVINQTNRHYLCRRLIVPFGQVQAVKRSDNNHQIVTIERESKSTSYLYQYFVFILNDRLRILQPTDSPTGWLYLALLHAMTSHSLPDQYTGMTGMERSFQLLNSAGCWSDQPFDSISRNILLQIATISPKVNYYPEHLTCAESIEWNTNSLPYSLQHFGYYLIAKKLVETSEELNFMHPSSTSTDELQKLLTNKNYNVKLLGKLYWDYRDSYNSTARLSAEMEQEICCPSATKSYEPIWEKCPNSTNYNFLRLVDGLYGTGDVKLKDSSDLRCFPLSRWVTSEYELKHIWIGLFKFIEELKTIQGDDQKDAIERFELLLDFLHYISSRYSSQIFYLQMLKSILKTSTCSLRSIAYPSFSDYKNIQDTSFQSHLLKFSGNLGYSKRSIAVQEIEDCFVKKCTYTNVNLPLVNQINTHIYEINMSIKSWRANGELRSFVENIQNHLYSVIIVPFNTKVSVISQKFTFELFEKHYQIHLNSTDKFINQKLLENAQQKFRNCHSNYFIKPTVCVEIVNEEKLFPEQIFPSTDFQINPLSDIANYFKKHLIESWKMFNSTKEYRKEYPSVEEINKHLDCFRQESTQFWDELVKSITLRNEFLFNMGLMLRILPTTLISILQQIWLKKTESNNSSLLFLTSEQCTLLGGIMVNWIVEQQLERALHFANQNKWEDFEKEISNIPHTNWIPSEHVPWLILELEMNITIREIQIEVTRHMIQPKIVEDNSTVRNIVMQMNMGEGKTSVILPMLALSLCSSSSSLVRIIVLKSLFPMNYQSLRYKLGGLLNRRVLPFACRRDMNFTDIQVNKIFNRLQQGLKKLDVVLISPEDILSFDLLTIDKCRQKQFDVGHSMLSIQRWIKTFTRDILDESDEILHVKYQLIYSIGRQQEVDGGLERWRTIQLVLNLVKQNAAYIAQQYNNDVFYKKISQRQSSFSEFRLLNHRPFPELCQKIANDWLNQNNYRQIDQQSILSFILDTNSTIDHLIGRFPPNTIQLFLIMRGLLSSEGLFVALKKRYRVNFGVNPNPRFHRLMAVPFRAKDVAAENTEFGHPDVAIILTQIAYYYSGLNDSQMLQCFDRLNQNESNPEMIYEEWISLEEENETISNIKQWKRVNLKDHQQRTQQLFPTLRYNMLIINYFLNHFVFPQEAKQFPHKLVSSAWDLSSSARSKIITGFSGTNDTQLLLPVHIHQCDLPELRKTDAIVLNNLLQEKNDHYHYLPISSNSDEILNRIVKDKPIIQVILDVGALFVDGTNRQIAINWLNLSDKTNIDYAVYFQSDSIFVCDRQYQHHAFLTSPASERLDRCVFYMDDIHTRGTDFKFPNDFRAAVTLGNGLTKDRLVQACMRLRKLGKHHWLSFWSSYEVHQQIQTMKKNSSEFKENENKDIDNRIFLTDILRWVYENTQQTTWDGLHHWAAQSLSFQRKVTAFRTIDWTNHQESFTNTMMENVARECLETEITDLKAMYGVPKIFQTILEIYLARYKHSNMCSSIEIHEAVSKRLYDYGGSKKLLAQLLDEEQQRELEKEQEMEEERQQKRPISVVPREPILHDEIKSLCDMQGPILNLSQLTSVFCPIGDAFLGTTFYRESQPDCWHKNLWITDEFKRVIQTRGETLDSFLRPARWVVIYRNQHIIFVSPHEANWLMGELYMLYYQEQIKKAWPTTLRLILPRTKRDQSILINTSALTIPPSIAPDSNVISFTIPVEWLVELYVFNGTLYFETTEEQTAYCRCLGVCPKPRTKIEEEAFEKDYIAIDGFVSNLDHRLHLQLNQCHFKVNPLVFIRKLIENRNHVHAPLKSHVGSIIFNALKLSV
ncbi:unnamed protein product [Adineta steineri]|uniref:ubiquitinyl hydrolase 1 n=1 Tax=Adineta steineri TaxID=433720 RepID=A0A815KZZ1_9BILA|nr:unnamed protein product [Adineta steineri]CAF3889487.1 unnamed protein product [Adineta steineri]